MDSINRYPIQKPIEELEIPQLTEKIEATEQQIPKTTAENNVSWINLIGALSLKNMPIEASEKIYKRVVGNAIEEGVLKAKERNQHRIDKHDVAPLPDREELDEIIGEYFLSIITSKEWIHWTFFSNYREN